MKRQHLMTDGVLYKLTPVNNSTIHNNLHLNIVKCDLEEGYMIDGVLYKPAIAQDSSIVKKTPEELEEERIAKLPKTWEESLPTHANHYYIGDGSIVKQVNDLPIDVISSWRNSVHTKEEGQAALAFLQLLWLRDEYNGNWKPDWNNKEQLKYVIYMNPYTINWTHDWNEYNFLVFKSKKLAELFIKNFKNLIEQLKDLC